MDAQPVRSERAPSTPAPPSRSAPFIQTKLTVGAADDRYEREADDVARQVVRRLASLPEDEGVAVPVAPTVRSARPSAAISRVAAADTNGMALDPVIERSIRSPGPGRPLEGGVLRRMSDAFGQDFSAVRTHVGPRASELNDRVSARAFTHGTNIFFRDGLPDHSTPAGSELLAHELTHVVQQSGDRLQRSAVIQRDEVEDQKRADFLARDVFSITDFTSPSTGSGHFDLRYDRPGGVATVTVRLNVEMLSVTSGNNRIGWTDQTAAAWVAQAQNGVQATWNDKFDFVLERDGWPNLRVKTRFVLDVGYTLMEDFTPGRTVPGPNGEVGAAGARIPTASGRQGSANVNGGDQQGTNAHFNVDAFAGDLTDWKEAKNGFDLKTEQREVVAVQKGAKMPNVDSDALQAKMARGDNDPVVRSAGCAKFDQTSANMMQHNATFLGYLSDSERKFLRALLDDGSIEVNFDRSGEVGTRSSERLTTFARRIDSIYPPLALRYPLTLTGPKRHVQTAVQFLKGLGVPNRFVEVHKGTFGSVTLTVGEYQATAADDVGSQITIAHEFGHMLGLADEYNQSTPATKARVAGTEGMDAKTAAAATAQGGGLPKFHNQQIGELELADRAGVRAPNNFGMYTDSLMNSGDVALPHHLTTVWEAFGEATRAYTDPTWWKIKPPE